MTREDGTYWDYEYDSLGQVSEAVPYWSDDTRVVGKQFEFDYDDIGNRTASSKGGDSSGNNKRTTSYSDNSVNQITSLTLPGYSELQGVAPEFASVTVNSQSAERKGEYYRKEIVTDSSSGNLFTSVTVSATGLTSTSGGIFTPESPVSLSYDDYGNLTEDGRWKYEWSAENRLVKMYTRDAVVTDLSATSFQPQTIEFQYDELGRRISKDVYDGVDPSTSLVSSTIFLYDGWNLIAEVDDSGASNEVLRSYTWGLDLSGSEQGAGGVGGLLMVHEGSKVHFVAMDGNGNVSALTDGTTVTAEYEYGPFGEVLKVMGEIGNEMPIRFSSKYQDIETGLVYYGFRYYSPVLGRWVNRDRFGESGGANLCILNRNNSISYIDILGLCFTGYASCLPKDSPLRSNPFGSNFKGNPPNYCAALHSILDNYLPLSRDISNSTTAYYDASFPNTLEHVKKKFTSEINNLVENYNCKGSLLRYRNLPVFNIDGYGTNERPVGSNLESDFGDLPQDSFPTPPSIYNPLLDFIGLEHPEVPLYLGNYTFRVGELQIDTFHDQNNCCSGSYKWSGTIIAIDGLGVAPSNVFNNMDHYNNGTGPASDWVLYYVAIMMAGMEHDLNGAPRELIFGKWNISGEGECK